MAQNQQVVFTKFAKNESINESFFDLQNTELPGEPAEGQVQIELQYISVDPYMRGRMNEAKNYFDTFTPEKPYTGGVVGKVIKSNSEKLKVGQVVGGFAAWSKFQNVPAAGLNPLPENIKSSYFLGALGMPGLSALLSMKNIWLTTDEIKNQKHTVFVSGAAGAVGSVVGQVCKAYGYKVIGSAGSDEKTNFLKELGFDHVINYKTDDTSEKIKEYAPEGLNMYFDNVGGETLDIALENMVQNGVVIMCGQISGYDVPKEQRYGYKNMFYVITKRLKLEGFIASDYLSQWKEGTGELVGLFMQQKLKVKETVYKGMDKVPEAFLGLLKGKNIGKMIVEV